MNKPAHAHSNLAAHVHANLEGAASRRTVFTKNTCLAKAGYS
jgi:hypothetical protein